MAFVLVVNFLKSVMLINLMKSLMLNFKKKSWFSFGSSGKSSEMWVKKEFGAYFMAPDELVEWIAQQISRAG